MKNILPLNKIQEKLISKDLSVTELSKYYLNRINKYDKSINSFLFVNKDNLLKESKSHDELIANLGKEVLFKHPLIGGIFSFKDLFLTKGIKTTAGSKVLKDYIPPYSSTVYERISKLGGLMIGKTNLDAWGHGASGENSDFGVTKNPRNETYVPGGSSSGSAASVASSFCSHSLGTDTGGSVRLPASFCGVVGYKPTYGGISRYGVIAMASSFDTVGVFSHFADDIKMIVDNVKGKDDLDSNIIDLKEDKKLKLKKIKVGLVKEYFSKGLDNSVEKDIKNSIKTLEAKGIKFLNVSIPSINESLIVYYVIQPAEVSSNLSRYDGIRYGNDRSFFSGEAKRRIALGTYVLSKGYSEKYYKNAIHVKKKIENDFENVFKKVDFLISPTSPVFGFKLGQKSANPLEMYLSDVYTCCANIAGLPAISIPTGNYNSDNLPGSFQLIGPKYSDFSLLDMASIYQKEISWNPITLF